MSTLQTHRLDYPLRIDIRKRFHPDDDFTVDIALRRGYVSTRQRSERRGEPFHATPDSHLVAHGNTGLKAGVTGITGSQDHHGAQSCRFVDFLGSCYQRRVQTRDAAVVVVDSGGGRPGRVKCLNEGSQP